VGWCRCAKNIHDPNGLLDTRSASPHVPVSMDAVGLEGILSETSSASSQKRRTSEKPNAKNIEKSCSYRQNENVPPAFKQYKIQGNASNLVQSHFGSPPLKELESGIAALFPLGLHPRAGSYAGRRTDFGDKKSSNCSGEIFRERNYCPRTAFSGRNSCSISSHPVMS